MVRACLHEPCCLEGVYVEGAMCMCSARGVAIGPLARCAICMPRPVGPAGPVTVPLAGPPLLASLSHSGPLPRRRPPAPSLCRASTA